MTEEHTNIRSLCKMYPILYDYDYKWDTESGRNLNSVLDGLGYELIDPTINGEYNDIKAYYSCKIRKVR